MYESIVTETWSPGDALVMGDMCHIFVINKDTEEVVCRVDVDGTSTQSVELCMQRAKAIASVPDLLRMLTGREISSTAMKCPNCDVEQGLVSSGGSKYTCIGCGYSEQR